MIGDDRQNRDASGGNPAFICFLDDGSVISMFGIMQIPDHVAFEGSILWSKHYDDLDPAWSVDASPNRPINLPAIPPICSPRRWPISPAIHVIAGAEGQI